MEKIILVLFEGLGLLLVLTVIAVLVATASFNLMVKEEVRQLFSRVDKENKTVSKEDIVGLPPCVQRWLERSRVIHFNI